MTLSPVEPTVPDYDEAVRSLRSSKSSRADVENGNLGSGTRQPRESVGYEKACFLDKFTNKATSQFHKARNFLGVAAVLVGLSAFILMVVLLSLAGTQGYKERVRIAFCTCSIVIVLSSGLFTASINRSFGEVVILMTFKLCLGIFMNGHLDAMLSPGVRGLYKS
jgi:hypothetical protein